jgi:hypothetical protein
MRSAILQKLGIHMNEPPSGERDIVYAIVGIRKMLEHDAQNKQFETLGFFCDWAVHTRLDRSGARRILTLLDQRLGRFNPVHPESIDPDGVIHKILSFDLFREQLLEFLRKNDLPTMWAEDEFVWKKFVVLYGEVVRDVPLSMTRSGCKFRYLREVVIAACKPSEAVVKANPNETFYGFKWTFVLDDRRSFTLPYTSNFPEAPVGWETLGRR